MLSNLIRKLLKINRRYFSNEILGNFQLFSIINCLNLKHVFELFNEYKGCIRRLVSTIIKNHFFPCSG